MSDPSQPLSYTFEIPSHPEALTVSQVVRRPYWLHTLLLLLTVLTTLTVGVQIAYNFHHGQATLSYGDGVLPLFHPLWIWHQPSRLLAGIPFAVGIMGILLAHEMGHFVYCVKNNVDATLPFFIPAPTPLGTFGAFIRIKSRIRSRQALIDIGIAGPIAGFVVALPLLLIGLAMSKPVSAIAPEGHWDIGFPLIFVLAHWFLSLFQHNSVPLGHLSLHPLAMAAWFGMLATSLNLIPGGQLDGGHIVYAYAPRAHKWVTRISIGVLLLMGLYWPSWLVWAIILGATGWRHPAVPVWPGLDLKRRALAWIGVVLLILSFIPQPFLAQGWF